MHVILLQTDSMLEPGIQDLCEALLTLEKKTEKKTE
jgi:hypothetical protein